jgi:D-serine deaminase-like pyridoxal phosphate-dependent protein
MASDIDEYVQAAVQVARETDRLLRLDATAQKIASAVGAPDQVDETAEALLEACVQQRVAVEIDRAKPPEQSDA